MGEEQGKVMRSRELADLNQTINDLSKKERDQVWKMTNDIKALVSTAPPLLAVGSVSLALAELLADQGVTR